MFFTKPGMIFYARLSYSQTTQAMSEKALKHFSRTDSLLKSTAIVSNLFTTAGISILQGFGVYGLFAANSIQMTIGGLLEIPTGVLADKVGNRKALLLALCLKFFVTLSFFFAVLCAHWQKSEWIWTFVALEAIVDAFACAFLNGSYQSAYLEWYRTYADFENKETSGDDAVFLASFKHSHWIRFALPASFCSAILLLERWWQTSSHQTGNDAVVFAAIGLIFILRTAVLLRVARDFRLIKMPASNPNEVRHRFAFSKPSTWLRLIATPYFPIYASSVFLNLFVMFYIVGQTFRSLKANDFHPTLTWSLGLLFGLSLHTLKNIGSVFLFPRLAQMANEKKILLVAFSASALLLPATFLFFWSSNVYFNFFALFGLGLALLIAADALQKSVESKLDTFTLVGQRATWISMATAVGMLFFGALSGGILLFHLESVATPLFCGLSFMAISVSAIPVSMLQNKGSETNFSTVIGKVLLVSVLTLGTTLLVLDTFYASLSMIAQQRKQEETTVNLVTGTLLEPLKQGSFIEASRRLDAIEKNHLNNLKCTQASFWSFRFDSCPPQMPLGPLLKSTYTDLKVNPKDQHVDGTVILYFDRSPLLKLIAERIFISFIFLSLIITCIYIKSYRVSKYLNDELQTLLDFINGGLRSAKNRKHPKIDEFRNMAIMIGNLFTERENYIRQEAYVATARQLAHDIRSPLAALDVAIKQLDYFPEDRRLLVRSAVQRIHDISNDLLRRQQSTLDGNDWFDETTKEEFSTHLLSGLMTTLVSEKRLQYRAKLGVEIETEIGDAAYGIFASIQQAEFKRALSNLVNNAVEALDAKGKVTARLSIADDAKDHVCIKIMDNGKGIPANILPRLMQAGETHGKANGSGLGLHHAKRCIENCGGSMAVTSKIGEGTTVTITLPRQSPPTWFMSEIGLKETNDVIILDDDNSIHEIWKGRFESYVKQGIVTLRHFSSPEDFRAWHGSHISRHSLYLCDYEFLNHNQNGLDVIRELGLAKHAILVTSRFEEEAIRKTCEELGVKLIPKNLAGFVSIQITPDNDKMLNPKPDAILIDDEDLVHLHWKLSAKRKNKILRTYAGVEEFWKDAESFPKDVPIYVDSDLAGDVKGEDIALIMNQRGFCNLHLATGYKASDFANIPWLKSVIGKTPPWES